MITREAGVRSVLARGARKSARRFGGSLDLFVQGIAQLSVRPGRDLDTLAGFDAIRGRPGLAADMGRFTGASMIAELTLRFGTDGGDPALFDSLVATLDALAVAPPGEACATALAGAWHMVAELGFAPSIDACSQCHVELPVEGALLFSHPAGGAVCARCARLAPSGRRLPAEARQSVREWIAGGSATVENESAGRAHQRLLREFLREHLTDNRALRAFDAWETQQWSAA